MKIWVTGAHGFLGKHVCKELKKRGHKVDAPTHEEVNLLFVKQVRDYFIQSKPDSVIHLAALCGGIGANSQRPGEFFYQNIMMGVQLMEEARWFIKNKFVALGTVCAYPKFTPVPFKEDDLWNGYPEETNAPYGLAKKMLLVQAQAYRQQFDFNAIYLVPVNLYGPGDNFDTGSSHVIPALIRKVDEAIKAGESEIKVWGTGLATREFLFVEDCARGICDALENYNKPEPMNLGTGKSISIMELVELIKELMGFEGVTTFEVNKPDGQPARQLDISRAEAEIEWKPKVDLREGLQRTIDWWRENGRY